MTFIKKHLVLLAAALFLVVDAILVQLQVAVPVWLLWLLIMAVLGFVTWQIVKTFIDEWHKAKKKRERNQLIVLGCVVAVVGVALFCGVHFSGLQQRLFPG